MEKVVGGYSFADENMANQARTETEGIKYVRARTDMSKPDQVFSVYHKLLEQEMFQTPVGYAYLKELQEYLKTMPGVHSEDIKPIPVKKNLEVDDSAGVSKIWRRRLLRVESKLRISVIANIVLGLLVIVMFAISLTSGQTTIINYERRLQDKYAAWQQELTEREAAVREAERRYDIETDVDDMQQDMTDTDGVQSDTGSSGM